MTSPTSPTDYQFLISMLARAAKGKTIEHKSEAQGEFTEPLTYGEATVYVAPGSYDAEKFKERLEKRERRHRIGKVAKADIVEAIAAVPVKEIFNKAASDKEFETQLFVIEYVMASREKTYAAYAQLAEIALPLMTKAAHKKAFPWAYKFSEGKAN